MELLGERGVEVLSGLKAPSPDYAALIRRRLAPLVEPCHSCYVDWENHMSDMTMVYWKGEKFWLGKLKEHPEIMTQGRTLKELEENLRDAFRMMVMEDVPEEHREKAIAV